MATGHATSGISHAGRRGFTIVELLIVIVVIAVLAAITIVAYNGIQDRANDSSVQTDIRQIATKLQAYYVENGSFPQTTGQMDSIGFKVSKGALGEHVNGGGGQYNLLYCRPQSNPTRYAIIASSKSGNLYQHIDGATTTVARTSWDTANVASATLCTNAGIPTATFQLWFYSASVWQSWVTN